MQQKQADSLSDLLQRLFDSAELRRWIHNCLGAEVYRELPENVSLAELTFQAARLIERMGHIDREFWAALEQIRPHHSDTIRAFANNWSDTSIPESTSVTQQRAVQIGVAVILLPMSIMK